MERRSGVSRGLYWSEVRTRVAPTIGLGSVYIGAVGTRAETVQVAVLLGG